MLDHNFISINQSRVNEREFELVEADVSDSRSRVLSLREFLRSSFLFVWILKVTTAPVQFEARADVGL